MPSAIGDQAEGLRRLLARQGLSVLRVSGCQTDSAAPTAAVINLAAALQDLGRDVLVIDEHSAPHGIAAALGLQPRFAFEESLCKARDLEELMLRGPAGLRILPLPRGARSLAQLGAEDERLLLKRCATAGFPVDTLLIDAAERDGLWFGAACEIVVLCGAAPESITGVYACMKRLNHDCARREFHLLVTGMAEAHASRIFENLRAAARRYLDVRVQLLGHVPSEGELERSLKLQLPVVSAFPEAVSAGRWRALARQVAGWPRPEEQASGLEEFMRRLIHSTRRRAEPCL